MITHTKGHMTIMKEHAEFLVSYYGDWKRAYHLKQVRLEALQRCLQDAEPEEVAEIEEDIFTVKALMVHIKRYGLMIEGRN